MNYVNGIWKDKFFALFFLIGRSCCQWIASAVSARRQTKMSHTAYSNSFKRVNEDGGTDGVIAFRMTIVLMVILLICSGSFELIAQSFQVSVSNVKKGGGNVVVELYKQETTWLKSPLKKSVLPPSADIVTTSFDIPPGKYAISVFQDLNADGELNRNFIGIPKEPIGFGNNYRPFGPPKFGSALVEFLPSSTSASIELYEAF